MGHKFNMGIKCHAKSNTLYHYRSSLLPQSNEAISSSQQKKKNVKLHIIITSSERIGSKLINSVS